MRGDVYELRAPRDLRGREQRGRRYAVVVQATELAVLSTWLVCPTSTSAPPSRFRPEVHVGDESTHVLVDQLTAVDQSRLGKHMGFLSLDEIDAVSTALVVVLGLA